MAPRRRGRIGSRSTAHCSRRLPGRHHVPRVYGFVNSGRAEPGDRAALQAWVAAGYPLGNHTAHHPSLGTVGIEAYLADVDAGEPLLAELLGPGQERVWKVFRYPYLWQGPLDHPVAHTVEVGAQLDEHLRGDAFALPDEREQDVLGPDVVVTELQRFAQRQLERLLGGV